MLKIVCLLMHPQLEQLLIDKDINDHPNSYGAMVVQSPTFTIEIDVLKNEHHVFSCCKTPGWNVAHNLDVYKVKNIKIGRKITCYNCHWVNL